MRLDWDKKTVLLPSVALALFLAALSCNMPNLDFSEDVSDIDASETPAPIEETRTMTPQVTSTNTPTPTATNTPIPLGPTMTPFAPGADSFAPLSEEGPWLVYKARKELNGPPSLASLFIANVDGSGRRLLGPGSVPASQVVISPNGDRFAYILEDAEGNPHLVIRLVPDGEIETDIRLISGEVKGDLSDQEGKWEQILRAVGESSSLSWSPHGHYLAFVAALEGPNTDVYRFDTWSNNIRRLTSSSLNAYLPRWSPNGEWVLHLRGESIGGSLELKMDGIWLVSPDGSSSRHIYDSGGAVDYFVEWVDGTRFYASRGTSLGLYDLTERTIDGSTPETVYVGPFASSRETSFDDLMSAVAFIIRPTDPAADAGTSPGIYLASLRDGGVDLVLSGEWRSIEWWSGKGVFLANGEQGTAFIRRTGEVVKRMDDLVNPVAPSPQGGWMVSYGEDGASVYTHIGVFIQQVYDGPVAEVIWQPRDEGFFLEVYQLENPVIGHQLYVLDLAEWEMNLVDLDTRGGYFWIQPTPEGL